MTTGLLLRRTARMKNAGALCGWEAGQLKIFERGSRNRRNRAPMVDRVRRNLPRFTDFSISRVVLELQGEEHQSETVKLSIGVLRESGIGPMVGGKFVRADRDEIANASGQD